MDQPDLQVDPKAEPHFSNPLRPLLPMTIVVALTAALAQVALPRVLDVFIANPYLNGFIVLVFFIGVAACYLQVILLNNSVRWIKRFAAQEEGHESLVPPSLLASLAALLRSRGAQAQISATSTRSILDSVATRIDEGREITRYLVNMLIFLGLLGTFYGLATTVPAVVDTIRSLAPKEGEGGVEIFARLMGGLESQLSGMGIAFASSLLGLAGSLIVGLLELFAGHGQNRFYRELEEWLSSITRVGYSSGEGEGNIEHSAIAAVLDNMGQQMEALQMMFTQTDVSRALVDEKLGDLTLAIERMADRMEINAPTTRALLRVAEGQEQLIEKLAERNERQESGEGIDAESRMRLRSIDVQMLRILEEISAGRQETMTELRTDLATLGRMLGAQAHDNGSQADNLAPVGRVRRKPPPKGQEG